MNLDYDILVNKENLLDSNYVPDNLVVTDNNENNFHNYFNPSLKPMIRGDILPYVEAMFVDAKKAGYELLLDSGYRSYEYQVEVLNRNIEKMGDEAYKVVALPGASEHQTGLAFDVAYFRDGKYDDDVKDSDKEIMWLMANAHKYGFILRYPKGKEDITGFNYEPWHYRFVGLELAKEIYEQGLTLEEYHLNKSR